MDYTNISKKIIELKNADLKLRDRLIQNGQLENGYNEEMEQLHTQNAEVLQTIMNKIGYPTIEKVGKEANNAAWLIIQHSISKPDFMKKSLELLEIAASTHKVNPKHLAYLTDRIAVLEGNPQSYGTQFDWNENGELSPNLYDDLAKVNQRRKSIGLNTLEEQTVLMQKQAKNEKQFPPINFEKRKQDMNQWRKKVGWIQ